MPSQNVFFNKNCSHQIGREETVEMLCVVLTSCCFEGIQSTGVMTLHHSSFHEKIALLCSSQEYTSCVYAVEVIMMHQRYRQSANAIVIMRTWYLFFVPLISARAPKEFIFKSLKNSKELLFSSNIQIFEISTCVTIET